MVMFPGFPEKRDYSSRRRKIAAKWVRIQLPFMYEDYGVVLPYTTPSLLREYINHPLPVSLTRSKRNSRIRVHRTRIQPRGIWQFRTRTLVGPAGEGEREVSLFVPRSCKIPSKLSTCLGEASPANQATLGSGKTHHYLRQKSIEAALDTIAAGGPSLVGTHSNRK
jgi:hypothetical protein